jgi:hypothetical protein
MLNTNNTVQFKDGSGNNRTINDITSVSFSARYVGGKVEETIDFELIEDWQEIIVKISVSGVFTAADLDYFIDKFWVSKSKQIVIDSKTFDVVSVDKKFNAQLWKKRNFRAQMTMNFELKTPGNPW